MPKAFKMQVANWQFEKLIQILTLNFKIKYNKCYFSLIFFFQSVIKAYDRQRKTILNQLLPLIN